MQIMFPMLFVPAVTLLSHVGIPCVGTVKGWLLHVRGVPVFAWVNTVCTGRSGLVGVNASLGHTSSYIVGKRKC